MRILGIDPGYATIGFGVLDFEKNKFKTIDYGVIITPAKMDFSTRLEMLYDDLAKIILKYSPNAVSVEELFFNTNIKTAIAVGHGRGVILLAAKKCGVSAFEYTPLQVKQAVVGYGRADKNQVQQLTKTILGLSEIPKPDDAADALALAICHAHSAGSILSKI